MGGDLCGKILRPVLADEPDAGLGEHREIVHRYVLGRREHLHLPGISPGGDRGRRDLLAHLGEIRPHGVRAQV